MTFVEDHDPAYYFTTITFRVGGILLRVPKHHFVEQSEVFRDMFELPVANDTVPDGLSDEQPLRLEGVSIADFRQLLRAMFPSRPLSIETFTLSQWTSVLRLSALWQMEDLKKSAAQALPTLSGSREEWTTLLDLSVHHQLPEVRKTAIQKLTPILQTAYFQNPFEMIATAKTYQVRSWFLIGLQGLVQRRELLSEADTKKLGWNTVLKVCRIRDKFNQAVTLESEFQEELMDMSD